MIGIEMQMEIKVEDLNKLFGDFSHFSNDINVKQLVIPIKKSEEELNNYYKKISLIKHNEKEFIDLINSEELQIQLFDELVSLVENDKRKLLNFVVNNLSQLIIENDFSSFLSKIDIKKVSNLFNLVNTMSSDSLVDPMYCFNQILIEKAFDCTKDKLSFKTKRDSKTVKEFNEVVQQLNNNLKNVFSFLNFIDTQTTMRPTILIVQPKDLWYLIWCDFEIIKHFNIVYSIYNKSLDEIFLNSNDLNEDEELCSLFDVFIDVKKELSDEVLSNLWKNKAFNSTLGKLISLSLINDCDEKFNAIIKINEWLELQHRSAYLSLTLKEKQILARKNIQNILAEQVKMRYEIKLWELFLGQKIRQVENYNEKMLSLNLPMYQAVIELFDRLKSENQLQNENELWLNNNIIQVIEVYKTEQNNSLVDTQKQSKIKITAFDFIQILRKMLIDLN